MNRLSTEKRASILSALVEGNSVNATARLTGSSKVTVLRLLADAGTVCAQWHDAHVRGLQSERVQCDEIWSFVGCKERAKKKGAKGHGSIWAWIGLDADTKLVIAYRLGERDSYEATLFMRDLASRLANQVQLSTDAFNGYEGAIESQFGRSVDYAQVIKMYGNAPREAQARYSPGVCISCEKRKVLGRPVDEDISTSHIERQNLTLRMQSRRYTRLTNGFSKKVENHWWALCLHFWYYNWARKHQTLKTTPAVAAGIANARMRMTDLVELIETQEREIGGRVTDYLPSPSAPSA